MSSSCSGFKAQCMKDLHVMCRLNTCVTVQWKLSSIGIGTQEHAALIKELKITEMFDQRSDVRSFEAVVRAAWQLPHQQYAGNKLVCIVLDRKKKRLHNSKSCKLPRSKKSFHLQFDRSGGRISIVKNRFQITSLTLWSQCLDTLASQPCVFRPVTTALS